MIRLLLVDDEPSVRSGLRMWFALQPDIAVVGEAGDGTEALELAQQLHPDVVVMDVCMPGVDGLASTARLRADRPESAVVVLTLHDNGEARARARDAGAAALVGKHETADALLAAIRAAAGSRRLACAARPPLATD